MGGINKDTMDGSFRRPGSIPFKWEIQPGVPKPYSSSPSPKPPPHTRKLTPPPPSKKTNHSHNPSPPSFSSPWLLPLPPPSLSRDLRDASPTSAPRFFRRSSSAFPSKQRPMSKAARAGTDSPREGQLLVGPPVSQGCFVMPSLRRNEEKKSLSSGGSGKFNYMAFRSPCRSASARSLPSHYASPSYYFASSSSSSLSSTPSRKKDGLERDDMKVATRWML